MAQETKPMVIVDDDFAHGVEHGYYPELDNDIKNNILRVMTLDEANKSDHFMTPPKQDKPNYYICNPYVEEKKFISLLDEPQIERDFGIAKENALKEALIMLGAKSIKLRKKDHKASSRETNVNLEGGNKVVSGEADFNYNNNKNQDFELNIEYEDPENKTDGYEKARKYILSHGLGVDPRLSEWLNRLQTRGELKGKEKLEVSFFDEIKKAWDLVLKIDAPTFNAKFGAGSKSASVRELNISLDVDFG